MDIILKYAALRPLATAPMSEIALASNSDFQNSLAQAVSGNQPSGQITAIAQDFADNHFLTSADQVAHGEQLLALLNQLRDEKLSIAHLPEALREILNDTPPGTLSAGLSRAR